MRIGRHFWSVGILLVAAASGLSQGDDRTGLAKRPQAHPPKSESGTLLVSELNTTIQRVEGAIRRVVLSSSQPPVPRDISQDRPAKREEIVSQGGYSNWGSPISSSPLVP